MIKFKCKVRDIDNVHSRFLVEERLQFIEMHKDFMGEIRLQVRGELKEIEWEEKNERRDSLNSTQSNFRWPAHVWIALGFSVVGRLLRHHTCLAGNYCAYCIVHYTRTSVINIPCQEILWWSSGEDSTLPSQGAWVPSLLREQRSHIPEHGQKKEKDTAKQYKIFSVSPFILLFVHLAHNNMTFSYLLKATF